MSAVSKYVASVVGCAETDVTSVTRFEGGNRHAVYIAYLFDQNGLSPRERGEFWRGYVGDELVATGTALEERVAWWERLSLFGSALWWTERWVLRLESEGSGAADPTVPRDVDYYEARVLSRLDRLESLLSAD